MSKDTKQRLDIIDKIKEYSYEELADLVDEGVITFDDIYVGTMMDKIWNTDDTKWPRA
jgi:hypothetical protein